MGRRSKALTGGTKAGHNAMIMLVGFGGGLISDALLYSLKMPGYDNKIPTCDALTMGDIGQLLFYGFMTFLGTLYHRQDLSAFSFGLLSGKLFPSVITSALAQYGVGRYVVMGLDRETGKLTPFTNVTETLTGGGKIIDKGLPNIPGVNTEEAKLAMAFHTDGPSNYGTYGFTESNYVTSRYY